MKLLQGMKKFVSLQCVFHGIRLLRLILKIDCRETINLFLMPIFLGMKKGSPLVDSLLCLFGINYLLFFASALSFRNY